MAKDKTSKLFYNDLTQEFDEQEACDVVFRVEGRTVGAHKLMLKIRSQYLYELASGWNHGQEPIPIGNTTYDVFKAILRYMYSGQIQLSNGNVFIVLAASIHYKMNILEDLCVYHIVKFMSIQNVCDYMNEAVNFNSTLLQKECCKMFTEKASEIMKEPSFTTLSQSTLSALLDVDQTNVVEISLFASVKSWMEQQCQNQGLKVNGTNMRHVIGDALYKIRFPTMTVHDFANSVTNIKGLLTDTETAQLFRKLIVFDNESVDCPFSGEVRCKLSWIQWCLKVLHLFVGGKVANKEKNIDIMQIE